MPSFTWSCPDPYARGPRLFQSPNAELAQPTNLGQTARGYVHIVPIYFNAHSRKIHNPDCDNRFPQISRSAHQLVFSRSSTCRLPTTVIKNSCQSNFDNRFLSSSQATGFRAVAVRTANLDKSARARFWSHPNSLSRATCVKACRHDVSAAAESALKQWSQVACIWRVLALVCRGGAASADEI